MLPRRGSCPVISRAASSGHSSCWHLKRSASEDEKRKAMKPKSSQKAAPAKKPAGAARPAAKEAPAKANATAKAMKSGPSRKEAAAPKPVEDSLGDSIAMLVEVTADLRDLVGEIRDMIAAALLEEEAQGDEEIEAVVVGEGEDEGGFE